MPLGGETSVPTLLNDLPSFDTGNGPTQVSLRAVRVLAAPTTGGNMHPTIPGRRRDGRFVYRLGNYCIYVESRRIRDVRSPTAVPRRQLVVQESSTLLVPHRFLTINAVT